jgi:hypothetical protein
MARLFPLQTMAEKSLKGDMRQGPMICGCHLGFIQQIYNNICKK